jgi:hypothetical protein
MSWFFTNPLWRSTPDQELHQSARRTIRIPNIVRKAGSFVPGVMGATSLASAIPEQVSQAAAGAFSSVKNAASALLPEAVLNNVPTIAATGAVFSSIIEAYNYASGTVSWGLWAIKVLPTGVQIGIGIGGIALAYWIWKGGSQNNVTVNVNVQQPPQTECNSSCPPQPPPLQETPSEPSLFLARKFAKAGETAITIHKTNKRLKHIQQECERLLFVPTALKVSETITKLDTLIKNKYVGFSPKEHLEPATTVIKEAEKEIQEYTRNIIRQIYAKGI